MVTLYGIKNCDTVKKARKWLDSHDIAYRFHDFRSDGIDPELIRGWNQDWERLLNRRGTTWRQLPDNEKDDLTGDVALQLMVRHPALIKRPVLVTKGQCLIGFEEDKYKQMFI